MSTAEVAPYATAEEYLAAERVSEQKHEYWGGVIHAMPDTTIGHARIAMNILGSLGNQLRGKPCEVFLSALKCEFERTQLASK